MLLAAAGAAATAAALYKQDMVRVANFASLKVEVFDPVDAAAAGQTGNRTTPELT